MARRSTSYDPRVIQEFADRLYKHANSIILVCTTLGVLAGAALGAGTGYTLTRGRGDQEILIAGAIGAVLIGVIGYAIGREIAFKYKLAAQVALCQKEIERNTRNGLDALRELVGALPGPTIPPRAAEPIDEVSPHDEHEADEEDDGFFDDGE